VKEDIAVKISIRRLAKWGFFGLAAVAVLCGLYLSVFFLPYPAFPHHGEYSGFSIYSDGELPQDIGLVLADARCRVEAMPLYRGGEPPRVFLCRSRRLFALIVKFAGKRHVGQGLLISVAGNAFFSESIIETVGRRCGGRPVHSRLQGSLSAAIAHEVAHDLVFSEVGFRPALRIPVWKSEGYADYSAHLAAAAMDRDYDFGNRVGVLLDDDFWQGSATASIDRRHFRWHLLVEYLCGVRGFHFADLLDEGVTEDSAWAEMMAWYSSDRDHR